MDASVAEAVPLVCAWELNGAREVNAARWLLALDRELRHLSKRTADCQTDRKSAAWKIVIAARLKESTHASNRWLTEHLQMGSPVARQAGGVRLIDVRRSVHRI